jgi:hypothetical protein
VTEGRIGAAPRRSRGAPAPALPFVALPLVALAILLLSLTGCGVGTDSQPRALTVSTTTSTTAPPDGGSARAGLWFTQEDRLVPVQRRLSDLSPDTIVKSLLAGPEPADGPGISSSVPSGTELRGTELTGGRLQVDLSEEFTTVIGPARQLALGQLTLSVTELEGVRSVSYLVEGEPLKIVTPSAGDVTAVTGCDFVSLLADPGTVDGNAEQVALLLQRKEELEDTCPAT